MPQEISSYPKDLAALVYSELQRRRAGPPILEVLVDLFEVMYFASLKTEETMPVVFHIVYIDPDRPDPKPPERLVHDRWSCVKLGSPIPLRSRDFLKIASASDPRTSSFSVFSDAFGQLSAWGLIDQGNSYHDFINFESDSGPDRPGLFQASILGIGHLAAYIGYEKIAELKQNSLLRTAIDVLQSGKIREALNAGINAYVHSLRVGWPDEFPKDDYPESIEESIEPWLTSLRRLLLRVQAIRHGGAFLLTDEDYPNGLSVKYKIGYDRLRSALQRYAVATKQASIASTIIGEDYLDSDAEEIPAVLHLDEVVAGYDLEEIRTELDGAIWFISLLTRVDGLVLLNKNLEVRGFGVEITVSEEPNEVLLSKDASANDRSVSKADYLRYGTRHRSMMRYCAQYPGSVGFIVSQDGDVRVVTNVNGRPVLWENIQLQLPAFVPRARRRRRNR
jgi:hypothetical protein